ncbi:MetQ/NlpA family ABC transporter substrate-binding protein [Streptomyces sp. ST2-7A]|uniref:MetQ/NlpA family ABC transporter substrate-binding protein n=1 Tax=Streptomyces sp. ST2-7A TaxID=2907214 RepID=UPI001F3B9869|nr:MetQ/NlpA family ABC transporter substrate-binding protein [Streptomyces sp. ST2-7A]MCE7079749.1 MetQ/NlpA family ABC transporter substrate-binding protein [Streptomyces sp. ST2-7A]
MRTRITTTALAGATALTLALTGCGTDSGTDSGTASAADGRGGELALTVAASPSPHADILGFVRDELAPGVGLELTVMEFTDYVLPNTALQNGEVDANYFQHRPYLDDFNTAQGTDLVPVADVHLEPLGLYSGVVTDLDGLAELAGTGEGATVAIPNDATNAGRALRLLADHDLIELAEGVGAEATPGDVTDARGLTLTELEAASLPRALGDVDAAVINGNYALEAALVPAEDALVLESAENNPYANILAVTAGSEEDEAIGLLADLLRSPEVRAHIEEAYEGSVLAAS